MNNLNFENFLGNASFFFLFLSMLLYWSQTALNFRKFNLGKFFMILANVCLVLLLCTRWKNSGHFPLSNLYESLLFLSWSFSSFHLFLENFSSSFTLSKLFNFENQNSEKNFLAALTSPAPLFTNAFATFSLPDDMQHASPLVPALQSNWLMMHVTVMILSYAALISGSLLSIAFLILSKNAEAAENDQKVVSDMSNSFQFNENGLIQTVQAIQTNQAQEQKKFLKEEFANTLDNLSYRILGLGFPLLTIGILSGAVWANEAWGSYWSWDPKETWALATWLVFAIYLHTRFVKGWKGRKPAIIASVGFFVVWICFLGVNLLGEGLHSYGFLK